MICLPYVPDFLTKTEADALFKFCQMQPHRRDKGMFGVTKRKLRYQCYSIEKNSRGPTIPLKDAPPIILELAKKLSDYTGKAINYLSIGGYADEHDHMNWHQHREDKAPGRDASVYIVSMGDVRTIGIRKKGDTKSVQKLDVAHGSLYTLPASFNETHEHAVLKSRTPKTLRIKIDCKHLEPPTTDKLSVLEKRIVKLHGGLKRDTEAIGTTLIEIRSHVPSGEWAGYLRKLAGRTDISERTLYRYISAVEKPQAKPKTIAKEISLEEALEKFVTKIVMQPYGYYAAKFAKYPQQHTTDLAAVAQQKEELYKEIGEICQRKKAAA